MRVTILAFGSRGDVQPYVALGLGLQRAGHKVRLVALSQFKAFVESRGLDFFSLGVDMRDLRKAGREFKLNMERMQESFWQASQGTEAIIFSTLGINAYHVAEKLEVPCLWALTIPIFGRTRSRPALLPALPLGSGQQRAISAEERGLLLPMDGERSRKSVRAGVRRTSCNLPGEEFYAFQTPF